MKTASINLSKIDKEKLFTGKNGDKYLNIVIWDNEKKDDYGNDFAIQQGLSKEDREAGVKAIYLGNGKDWDKKEENTINDPLLDKAEANISSGTSPIDDSLPF